ncbi:MAG: hypothetical protein GF411_17170, partial [Candidatus Lokiarchaeota archaeon]|nr:hypothetical protein [Candidatus Lokiarchaeota archaeon]
MTEVGGGWYKYSFTSYDPDEDYVSSCDAGTDSVDARVVYAISSTADIRAIREQTDNLPADPASETNVDANESKIDVIDGNADTIIGKLPTNYIMGSSDQSDKDDNID